MSEIENTTEFNKLWQQVDLGETDVVQVNADGQDMPKELHVLGIIVAPADGTLHTIYRGWHNRDGDVRSCVQGWICARGPLLLFPAETKIIKARSQYEAGPI